MTITFEGRTFPTLRAFGIAFPAYGRYRDMARDPAIQTIADMERAIAAMRAEGRKRSTASARRTGITAYSNAAPARRAP